MMIAGRANLQTVRERLGHASLRAIEHYLHTLPNTDDTLKRLLADTELEKAALKEIAKGNF